MKIKTKQKGFTLLEVIVVISIIAVLFLIGIPGYRAQERRMEVKNAAKELRSILWEAQSRALAPSRADVVEYKLVFLTAVDNCGVDVNLTEVYSDSGIEPKVIKNVKLGSVICTKNIKFDGMVFSTSSSVVVSYKIGDNRTAGLVRFYEGGSTTEILKNEMIIRVYSKTVGGNYNYDIKINKLVNNISLSLSTT